MKLPVNDPRSRIQGQHLTRAAYVYVRQSSPYQVEHNLESQRRQYAFAQWAEAAGWPKERIVVLDDDQGTTGSLAGTRGGFVEMVKAVGRGEVGLVASLELSRLARNSPDWHQLIYLCRFTDTLIADEHGVYDPAVGADRMVLGIRGQVSEMEVDALVHRMQEARWNKARRGEFLTIPPAGYDVDDLGQLVMTSDESVRHAVETVFAKFDELGSGRQVWVWWRNEGLKFPVRRPALRSHPVAWMEPTYRMVMGALRHPIYAGAYVFGRSKTIREIDPDDPRQVVSRRVVRTKEWPVLIQEHHLGYISYQKFLENQRRIEGNAMMSSKSDRTGAGPAREGQALLQGLIRCGQCGRPMRISYGGARGSPTAKRTMQYRCWRARQLIAQEKDCQIVGGKRIDEVVIEAFLEVTREAGPAAAALAEEQLRGEGDAVARALELQLQKAEYEAQRAERQYQAVEPENRIVARELERRWNVSLTEVESLRAQAQAARERHRPLTEAEVEKARALGSNVRNIWSAPTTTDRDRKRLLRCLIEEVQLRSENKFYAVRIVWKGGAVTDREVVRHSRGNHEHATAQDTVDLVRSLVEEFDDAQVARILNRQGRRTGSGNPFTRQRVASLRAGLGLEPCAKTKARDPQEGPFTADEAAMQLGVTTTTIHRWLREGVLAGTQAAPSAPWRIVLTEEVRRRVSGGEAPRGWVGLTEAAERLGTSKPHVVYLVRTGKLKAVRTTVGKRRCWRIDVSSADSGREPGLFDQTGTGDSEEA